MGNGGIVPCILNLGIRWKWVVSFLAPSASPPGRQAWVLIGWEAACAPESVWTLWRREEPFAQDRNRTPSSVVHPRSLIAIPTELNRLLVLAWCVTQTRSTPVRAPMMSHLFHSVTTVTQTGLHAIRQRRRFYVKTTDKKGRSQRL
jgi:hypothetical protein